VGWLGSRLAAMTVFRNVSVSMMVIDGKGVVDLRGLAARGTW